MKIVGQTESNQYVVSEVFKLIDTYGIPLPIAMDLLRSKGYIISPIHFIIEAHSNGWKRSTILNKLDEAYIDVFGVKYRDDVFKLIIKYLNSQNLTN